MISSHLKAGYPAIAISTPDEGQVTKWLENERGERPVFTYSANQEIREDGTAVQPSASWSDAISWAAAEPERVIVISDAQHVIGNPPIYRALLDACPRLKAIGSTVVFVSPAWTLPAELAHVVPVIDWPLPTREELRGPLETIAESASIDLNGNTARMLDAAAGLTLDEAESAFALSCIEIGDITPEIVAREKMRRIASTGYMSVAQPVPVESVGGLGALKSYVTDEIIPSFGDDQLRVACFQV